MGKKKCCSSSSTSTSLSTSCSSKYSKCEDKCKIKCYPTYYPNNCVGRSNCAPCLPIIPIQPVQSSSTYTVNQTITTTSASLTPTSPNVNLFNMTTGQTVYLPPISTLSGTNYIKMFVISNISASTTFQILASGSDILTVNNSTNYLLGTLNAITIYAVFIPNAISYWVCN
jgi:hypothetical protein